MLIRINDKCKEEIDKINNRNKEKYVKKMSKEEVKKEITDLLSKDKIKKPCS